jgi:TolB-like protein/Flp pilus assembly protein TadD/DNA-binding winged helix-turn-helix (wHTH) protein
MVTDAGDLQNGFRLGDWVVEPQTGCMSGQGRSHTLTTQQIAILKALAARRGEVVPRDLLREQAWPGQQATDDVLRATMRELRQLLGDSPKDLRYVVPVGRSGYTLIAPVEPLTQMAAPVAGSPREVVIADSRVINGAQKFVSELGRRHVFRVLGAYLLGMWILLQVAQTTFEPLHFPDWWMSALTILAVIGIPIVGILAWSYDITPGGIVRDSGDTARLQLPRARRAMAPALVFGVALMAGVTGFAWWRSIADADRTSPPADEPSAQSVAVLPLVDMTSGGGNEYLGDGFAEEISAQLAQIPGLRVAARTSAFEFKGQRLDVRKIGNALGVRNVLEGSVRRDGDKLRVTVQLIDALNGYHVWAGTYDRDWADAIAIQDDISRKITQALRVVLTPESERRLQRAGVVNLAAYDSYLAGVSALRKSSDLSQLNRAADFFGKAMTLDPGFSRAYAGMCEVGVGRYYRTQAPADVAAAEAACRKALELEPTREETEMALGSLYLASGRYEQAEALFGRLVVSRPQDSEVFAGLANAQAELGRREDAERSFRKSVEVEPAYWGAHAKLGAFLFQTGRAEEAVIAFQKAVELAPGSANVHSNLGGALMLATRLDEAAAAFEKSLAIEPSRSAQANLGTLYYYAGRYQDAARQYESASALASGDQGIVGSLADALWFIPGRRPDAVRLYEKAAHLAEEALKVNPVDAQVIASLGYYCGRTGDSECAARELARAESLRGDDMYVQYFIALAAADRGDQAQAREAIGRAERSGYPRKLLEADPVLKQFVTGRKS